jgi:exonuclease III
MPNILRIIEWNINGRSGYMQYTIPKFIIDEIMIHNPEADIVVLTEFVMASGWDYIREVLEKKYHLFTSPYISGQNGVLIAIRKNKEGLEADSAIVSSDLNTAQIEKPNYLQVSVLFNNKPITIIGTRIRVETSNDTTEEQKKSFKYEQFKALDNHLSSMHDKYVICTGDFNAYWKNSKGCIWKELSNYTLPKASKTFELFTAWDPNKRQFSYVLPDKSLCTFDHILARGIKVIEKSVDYSWNFVTEENGYGSLRPEDYKSHLVGLPDHAILSATVKLKD